MKESKHGIISSVKNSKVYKTVYYYIDNLINKFDNDHIWIMASGISFNVLICLIPFFLMMLTILGLYLDSNTVQDRLINYLNSMIPLPEQYKERLVSELIDRTKELSTNTFLTGAIGIGGLFWTVSGLFSAMREVLRKIYQVNSDLNYFIGKLRDFLLVIVSVVLFLTSMALTSSIQVVEIYSQGLFGEHIVLSFFQKIIPIILGLLVSFFLFYVLYAYIPYWKFNRKVVLFSSIIGSIFFEALKYLFSFYILKIANFGRIYGAYATIVITIFYIYYISVVFVVGAEFGQIYFQKNKDKLKTP